MNIAVFLSTRIVLPVLCLGHTCGKIGIIDYIRMYVFSHIEQLGNGRCYVYTFKLGNVELVFYVVVSFTQ